MPGCQEITDSLRYAKCFRVVGTFPAPYTKWNEKIGHFLATAEMREWDAPCGYTPQAIVRFVTPDHPFYVVVLTGQCDPLRVGIILFMPGAPAEYRELGDGRKVLLDLITQAIYPNQQDRFLIEDFPGAHLTGVHRAMAISDTGIVSSEEGPIPIRLAQPTYPEFAKEAQIQGQVDLLVLVDRDGRIKNIKVTKGVTGLNESAVAAIREWEFKPATLSEEPVEAWVGVSVVFSGYDTVRVRY